MLGLDDVHNASVVPMVDGEVVAGSDEEKSSRVKGDVGFPFQEAHYCPSHAVVDSVKFQSSCNSQRRLASPTSAYAAASLDAASAVISARRV